MSVTTPPTVQAFRQYFGKIFQYGDLYPESVIQDRIDDAAEEIQPTTFGKYYTRAVMYLSAHYLVLFTEANQKSELAPGSSAVSTSQGIMTNTGVGDLTRTIEIPEYKGLDEKYLASTWFGQEFLRIRRKMARGGLIANEGFGTTVLTEIPQSFEGSIY